MATRLHHLHVSLEHVEPKVQREFVVPSDLRLDRLHEVLQIVMGWTDSHLHEFIVGPLRDAARYGQPDPAFDGFSAPTRQEQRYTLAQIASEKGDKFRYWYDFGDDWQHQISVKAVFDASMGQGQTLFCIKARGACPPEDCGGPPGYAQLIETLSEPDHPEHGAIKDWIGRHFDPGFVDVDAINEALAELEKSWLPRSRGKRPTR